MAHPCPASSPADAEPRKDTHDDTVTVAALDAVELTEILEYFIERLDILTEHDLAELLFNQCSPLRHRRPSSRPHPSHPPAEHQPNFPLTNVGASFRVAGADRSER